MATKLSLKEQRQVEVLSRYYKIDMEREVITIPFHFDKASDLFDPNIGQTKSLRLNDEIMQKISTIAEKIPLDFKIDISLSIDDYENYKPKEIIQSLKDGFELFHYAFRDSKRDSKVKFAIFCVIGIAFFGLWAWLSLYNFSSKETVINKSILEILYAIPCVLFWEAIYVIFWPNKSYNSINYSLIKQINSFSLFNVKQKLVGFMNKSQFLDGWQEIRKREKFFKLSFMWIGTILLVLVVLNILALVDARHLDHPESFHIGVANIVVACISFIAGLIACITAFAIYMERLKIRKFSLIFTIVLITSSLADLIISIILFTNYKGTGYELAFSVIIFAAGLYLLFCVLYLSRLQKKANKKKK